MKKTKVICSILGTMGILMVSIGMVLQGEESLSKDGKIHIQEVNIQNMAASANILVHEESNTKDSEDSLVLTTVEMETAPASIIVPPRIEVYEGMTLEELAAKLDRNLGSGYIAGKGYLIASQCIQKGIDPYLAVAIILHETGCKYNCSSLVRNCNNVGGQKGSPGCNGGSYKAFATLDEGIIGFVDNLYRNYYARGLTTVETIAPKYAQSSAWPAKINQYIQQIRAN